jgi:hypothetical protein
MAVEPGSRTISQLAARTGWQFNVKVHVHTSTRVAPTSSAPGSSLGVAFRCSFPTGATDAFWCGKVQPTRPQRCHARIETINRYGAQQRSPETCNVYSYSYRAGEPLVSTNVGCSYCRFC